MKYYISSLNGSGIEADSFDEFVAYLKDMAETAEKQSTEKANCLQRIPR